MRLLLMRHAKALPRDEHLFADDSKRPLSKAGIKEHKRVSKMLRKMGVCFDHILTSPYERAIETAMITKKVFDFEDTPIECKSLSDDFSVDDVLKLVGSYGPKETLLLVGHEPYMSTLASALLWPGHPMGVDFKKSAIMSVRFNEVPEKGQGILEFFLRPKLLMSLHKHRKGDSVPGLKMKKNGMIEGAIMMESAKGGKKFDKKAPKKDKDDDD
jgi:phosphohistidine phosphatase